MLELRRVQQEEALGGLFFNLVCNIILLFGAEATDCAHKRFSYNKLPMSPPRVYRLSFLVLAISRTVRHRMQSRSKDGMRGVLSPLPFPSRTFFLFFLTRNSAVHRGVMAEVYRNVVCAMGFDASTDALPQAHPKMFHDAELKHYNTVLWARGGACSHNSGKRV